jgi:hypothetical protein
MHDWFRDEASRFAPLPYHENPVPAPGALAPRAWWSASDAARLSLNGTWAFRLAPTASGTGPGFGADDPAATAGWDRITVPGHWVVLQGHGGPIYTGCAYPFPVDPPRTPDENPTGDHWRVFDLPGAWPDGGASVLRFEGVDSCARVWLNGTELGTSPAVGCRTSSPSGICCGSAGTCWRYGCTSGRPGPIWRTRTCGGCLASSATSPSTTARRAVRRTSSCTRVTTTPPVRARCGWSVTCPAASWCPSSVWTSPPVRRRPCRSSRGARRCPGCTTGSWSPTASGSGCGSGFAASPSRTGFSRSTGGGSCSGVSTGTSSTPRPGGRWTWRRCAGTSC